MMNKDELFFENETRKHQQEVAKNMLLFAQEIIKRATVHDASKFEPPEREIFVEYTPKLKNTEYGSDEYKKYMKEMDEAIQVHYSKNKHHPQFNDINGYSYQTLNDPIRSMTLFDVIEMLCDWHAATKRHATGDISKSIDINEERFKINEQLSAMFRNTIGWMQIIQSQENKKV
jgi:hypothetical protein